MESAARNHRSSASAASWRLTACLLLICLPVAAAPDPADPTPRDLVAAYVDAVRGARWDEARTLWSPDYLAECEALGITYRDQPCAWDLASPIILYRDALRSGRGRIEVSSAEAHGAEQRIQVRLTMDEAGQVYTYGAVRVDRQWRLAGRTWLEGRHWQLHRTRYCRIYSRQPDRLDPATCAALDRFIEQTARRLGVPARRIDILAEAGIPYYLADDETVADLTGYSTKGMADLACGAVISSQFPHFHELAHLLVNWALQEVPLYTLPAVQEGLACRLGGRWGRSPEVILYTGWFHLDLGLITPVEILTREGFHAAAAGPDGSYGVGALVCDLVVENAGWPALLELYAALSGDLAVVTQLDAAVVAAAVGRACGWPPDTTPEALSVAVSEHSRRWRRCGVAPGVPAADDQGSTVLAVAEPGVEVRLQASRAVFKVTEAAWPVLLLVDDGSASVRDGDGAGASSLFAEHRPDHVWDGTRWGVMCRPGTIGLYDYTTNVLLATWVADFSGERPLGEGGDRYLVFSLDWPPPSVDDPAPIASIRLVDP